MASSLRCCTDIDFIGRTTENIHGSRLPTARDALKVFFHNHRTRKQTIRESARNATTELLKLWNKTKIPRIQDIHIIEKLEGFYQEWQKLMQNRNRVNEVQKLRQSHFETKLDVLLDLGKSDALETMRACEQSVKDPSQKEMWKEEIGFYEDQKSARKACIGGIDFKEKSTEKKRALKVARKDLEKEKLRARQEKDRRLREVSDAKLHVDEILSSEDEDFPDDFEASCSSAPRKKRGRKNVITPEVVEVIDASKISSNSAAKLLAAAAQSLGCDIAGTNINTRSVERLRGKYRNLQAAEIKKIFSPSSVLTVHWDGKLMQSPTGHEVQERQAIIVTGVSTSQMLAAPVVPNGTGKAIAEAVVNTLKDWGCTENVKAMAFDTTSVNTGCKAGAAILVERLLEKDLLWLPCRHHVLEIVLEAVFKSVMGESTGPEVILFKSFQEEWSRIDKTSFNPLNHSARGRFAVDAETSAKIVEFANTQISVGQPRDDYLELLQLVIIFLNSSPPSGIKFKPPGPMHSTRWMAKAIYSLKVWLFRKQFRVSRQHEAALLRVCLFIVNVYLQAWYSAPSAISAPRNDLELLNKLKDYVKVDRTVAEAALRKFLNHLWYLSEELLGLAFFDSELSLDTKRALVQALQSKEGEEDPPKKEAFS